MALDFQPEQSIDFQPETVAQPPQDYAKQNDPTMLGDVGHLLETFYNDTAGNRP